MSVSYPWAQQFAPYMADRGISTSAIKSPMALGSRLTQARRHLVAHHHFARKLAFGFSTDDTLKITDNLLGMDEVLENP